MPNPAPEPPARRVVHLEDLADAEQGGRPPVLRVVRSPRDRGVTLTSWDDWLRLAEPIVGGWASTLHGALLMLLAFAALVVVIGLAFGFAGVLLGLLLGLIMWSAVTRPAR